MQRDAAIVDLQGGKEEKNPFRVKHPWRASETISPRNASAFGGGRADVAGGDSDLMMNLWVAGIIHGPYCHHSGLFRSARPYHKQLQINNLISNMHIECWREFG